MNQKPKTPKDASAVILLNDAGDKVLWAQRNPNLTFLGGWHAFSGGKLESSDAEVNVKNCADEETAKFIVCAVRETFEEAGVLLVRNGEKLTKGQRASLHDDLISGRMTFDEILAHWNLWIDAEDFQYTGFWTTPPFSPIRFKTRFFLAVCPPKQTPFAAITELENVEFIAPKEALSQWKNSQVLISPPVLLSLKTLAENQQINSCLDFEIHNPNAESEMSDLKSQIKINQSEISNNQSEISDLKSQISNHQSEISDLKSQNKHPDFENQKPKTKDQRPKTISQILLEKSQIADGIIPYIEFNPRTICFPLKTETLPPATHTNCFIVGRERFVVIDAASKDATEQKNLHDLIDSFVEKKYECAAIITTHQHQDHFGGELILQTHLREKFDLQIPLAAHENTAEFLRGKVEFQLILKDGDDFDLIDETGAEFRLQTIHTPGHASGLLAFYDEESGFLLSGDNVVNSSSVVIAPPDGNLADYLASLERLKNLPNLKFLCGSHGSAVFDARAKIESYIAHRIERENQILAAIKNGAKTVSEIVAAVYFELNPELVSLAEKSVEAHLEKIHAQIN